MRKLRVDEPTDGSVMSEIDVEYNFISDTLEEIIKMVVPGEDISTWRKLRNCISKHIKDRDISKDLADQFIEIINLGWAKIQVIEMQLIPPKIQKQMIEEWDAVPLKDIFSVREPKNTKDELYLLEELNKTFPRWAVMAEDVKSKKICLDFPIEKLSTPDGKYNGICVNYHVHDGYVVGFGMEFKSFTKKEFIEFSRGALLPKRQMFAYSELSFRGELPTKTIWEINK
jgi:hypothetical protein